MKEEKRSAQAFIIEKAMMIKKKRDSGEENTFKQSDAAKYTLPRMVYKSNVSLEAFDENQVIRFDSGKESMKKIIEWIE